MNNEKNLAQFLAMAEDIVFESELIPTYGDMEMMLEQDGVTLNRHAKNYLSEIASLPALDADAVDKLVRRLVQDDPFAKSDLIEGTMRLVVCAAKRYCGRGVTFLDLLQEGSLGLVGAVEEYSADRGDFRTYAACCIAEALDNAVAEAEASGKIPEHVTELLNKISRSDMMLEEKLGREATPEEIAADTGLDLEEVTAIMEIMEDVASHEAAESGNAEEGHEHHHHDHDCHDPDCTEHHHYDPGRHTHS